MYIQVPICRQGLFTLLGTVHRAKDPHRSRAAAAILNNIHFHPNNISVLYRAELRLKQAALTQLNGGQADFETILATDAFAFLLVAGWILNIYLCVRFR